MIAKPVVLGLCAAACVTAAAGGAYVAVRHNETSRAEPAAVAAPAAAPTPASAVAETEAIVTPTTPAEPAPTPALKPQPALKEGVERTRPQSTRPAQPQIAQRPVTPPSVSRSPSASPAESPRPVETPRESTLPERTPPARESTGSPTAAPTLPAVVETPAPEPPPPPRPQFVEVQVPESSVVGLRVVTPLSSETARVEDRVEASVTRDVMADGQLAIPAGSRVLGDVVTAERGGKMKDKARLGVRFHTLVLADGRHVPFRTDAIYREGSSPGAESARKIGGAAIGGAVLGAIIGGAKGAAIGGATGAAGGSAVVMAGDRNAATMPAGTIVTVRLSAPVTINVEREFF